jgi:hypothetical protein
MLSAGFETTIPASERPQTYAFDSAATGTGKELHLRSNIPHYFVGNLLASYELLPLELNPPPLKLRRR